MALTSDAVDWAYANGVQLLTHSNGEGASDMLIAATEALVAENVKVLREGEDYWVTQRITAGIRALDGEPETATGSTVIIECTPLPLRARARYFRDGIDAVVSARPKIAPEALSPQAKTTNYLNMMLAQAEASAGRSVTRDFSASSGSPAAVPAAAATGAGSLPAPPSRVSAMPIETIASSAAA